MMNCRCTDIACKLITWASLVSNAPAEAHLHNVLLPHAGLPCIHSALYDYHLAYQQRASDSMHADQLITHAGSAEGARLACRAARRRRRAGSTALRGSSQARLQCSEVQDTWHQQGSHLQEVSGAAACRHEPHAAPASCQAHACGCVLILVIVI